MNLHLHLRKRSPSKKWAPELLEPRILLANSTVVVSEFMAGNRASLIDAFGESSDWIELHNPTDATVDLIGWRLTDDATELDKWTFSTSTPLASQQRLVVWASGRDLIDSEGKLHTNFKLSMDGEYLALVRPSGEVASSYGSLLVDYPRQTEDVSYGLDAQGAVRFFETPTPGEANQSGTLGFVADTRFSVDRGFFSEPFTLEITSATPQATLVYTLDGSEPSPGHGTLVQGGPAGPLARIAVDSTTTVRAMAFREQWQPTNIDTQTYLFLEQVIRQTGDGLPDNWGHAGADYEMDPQIVDSPRYRDRIIDGLKSLPSLSLVTDIDNFFGRAGGIYLSGQGSPRRTSVELLLADGSQGFQVDGSVEIQGGSSTNRWKVDKLSMQLKFKREYGDANLRYPLFGDAATQSFDTLIIDARLNQAWHYGGRWGAADQRNRAQFTRDQFVADLQNQLGGQAPHGQWVHLYINGIYWGMHNLHERPDEHFAAAYLGGAETDYDIIKHDSRVVHGSYASYRALLDAVNANVRSDAAYRVVEGMLDIDGFIDYVLLNYYVGNTDWAHHNWYASFNDQSGDGQWRYHSWDAEHVLKEIDDDVTDRDDELGPTHVHQRLMRNQEYRWKFADAIQKHFFNAGLFTPDRAAAVYQHRLEAVELATVPESARWGDNQRQTPYTPDVEWARERARLLNEYFPRRTEIVIRQLRDANFFPEWDAPSFNVHGGRVPPDFSVQLRADGEIFFTTDGSDPRISDTSTAYSAPFRVKDTVLIQARARIGDDWSALVQATFQPSLAGDFSGNGQLDAADIDLLFAATRQTPVAKSFDLNDDDHIDDKDADYWITELARTRRGDLNLDGEVSFADFVSFAANFGREDAGWSDGDLSGDGKVTFADFLILAREFGFSAEQHSD